MDPNLATSDEIAAAYLEWLDTPEPDASREALLQAIEVVAADVRALTGKVQAMPLH